MVQRFVCYASLKLCIGNSLDSVAEVHGNVEASRAMERDGRVNGGGNVWRKHIRGALGMPGCLLGSVHAVLFGVCVRGICSNMCGVPELRLLS